ncbi:hypothetical protein ACFLQW_00905, partial [Candidatus Zixiibacteriota bacterium]
CIAKRGRMKRTRRKFISAIMVVCSIGLGEMPAWGQAECDTLYPLLQNFVVDHVRANEIWIEHFIDCSTIDNAFGGVVLSEIGQEGQKDRVVIATYQPRRGWFYRFGERAPGIRLLRPSPRIDVDGDGELDFVFVGLDDVTLKHRSYQISFMENGKKRPNGRIDLSKGLAIDSLLPAPTGQPRPLQIIDRRGWDIGGLTPQTALVSYRYMIWGTAWDTAAYINRTVDYIDRYPIMKQREDYIKALPQTGDLRYDTEAEYEAFLVNLVGFCLDQSNLDREAEGYEKAKEILDRVRYKGSTNVLDAPQSVGEQLRRALPEAKKLPRK